MVEGCVRVTFRRNNVNSLQTSRDVTENNHQNTADVLENVPQNIPADILSELSERQKNIIGRMIETGQRNALENVLENTTETSATLASYFNVNEKTIRRDLQTLQTKGIIRHDGPDKGGHWKVIVKKQ